MQIVAGRFRGRTIATPRGSTTRPTQARVRAAIFNSLQQDIEGAYFIDICAGSGAMGLEALSRGANEVVFIENDRRAIQCIESNIASLHVKHEARMITCSAILALKQLVKKGKLADIIYFDPPYSSELTLEVIHEVDKGGILKDEGLFIVEERTSAHLDQLELATLLFQKSKSYGDSTLYTYINRVIQ